MKYRITLLLALSFIALSCKKLDEFTMFNIPYNQTVTIPSSSGVDLPFDLFTPEVETDSESTFSVNNTRKDLIEEIKLSKLSLNVQSPAGEDFSFLESISVFINADGLSEVKIAWNDNVASNSTDTLELEVLNFDLQEYIKKDKFTLRLNTTTDEFLANDYQIEIRSLFFVDAKLKE